MLEVTDLHAGYGGFQVLQGMTLTVGAGTRGLAGSERRWQNHFEQ